MAAKKTTKLTSAKKTSSELSSRKVARSVSKKASVLSLIGFRDKRLVIIAGVILVALVGYLAKGLFVAALVNGVPVSRISVIRELESQGGGQTLDTLVTELLIKQEATKNKIVVSQEDIDDKISEIEETVIGPGQTLDDLLAFQGLTREEFGERLKIQLELEMLLEERINVSDEEVEEIFEQSKDSYPETLSESEIREQISDQLMQSKLQTEIQSFIDELKANASLQYFVDYQLEEL